MLLAGVPVFGALALASLLWMHAQRGAQSAAALGSVEDLAHLSVGIANLVQELQTERALTALTLGYAQKAADPLEEDTAPRAKRLAGEARERMLVQRASTDRARELLLRFLEGKNLEALPEGLKRDLTDSREKLDRLVEIRDRADQEKLLLIENIDFFAGVNDELVDATAALTQLSDDGDLLRSISALVSVMQVKERASQEHALLARVFAVGEFPPGSYRSFVRLTTEEQVYVNVLRTTASDEHVELYEASKHTEQAKQAESMRKRALETIEEELSGDAGEWFAAEASRVEALRAIEKQLSAEVRQAAAGKLAMIAESRRTSLGLSGAVLVLSTLLAILIGRGIDGSIGALTQAAARVQAEQDFSVRAEKTTSDELGHLTDVFNQMLGGIQARDTELEEYQKHLEDKVKQRTLELSERNTAMRLVLDNVDQGLATVLPNGTLGAERSAMFDRWFGAPSATSRLGQHLAGNDSDRAELIDVSWEEVVEGFFPLELTLGQMPTILHRADRQYTLTYKPVLNEGELLGALVIVTDVTEEAARRRREAEQAERIAVFERLVRDRAGFSEFFEEGARLVKAITQSGGDITELRRDVHTLKGNCAIYSIQSVATACHEVESAFDDAVDPMTVSTEPIRVSWAKFAGRAKSLMGGENEQVVVIEDTELERVLGLVRSRRPHATLHDELSRLRYEPLSTRFYRVGEHAKAIARKLGKPEPLIESEANDIRLPAPAWADFWSAFSHVIRNAVDHGLETETDRLAAGKPRFGVVHLSANASEHGLEIEFRDDGAGIAWDTVRERAKSMGLPHQTRAELVEALFAESLSTAQDISETSGRGVGMAAVLRATDSLGGRIEVHSSPGQGTTLVFRFPPETLRQNEAAA